MITAEAAVRSAELMAQFNDEVDEFREAAWTGNVVESVLRIRAVIELLQASSTDSLLEIVSQATAIPAQSS